MKRTKNTIFVVLMAFNLLFAAQAAADIIVPGLTACCEYDHEDLSCIGGVCAEESCYSSYPAPIFGICGTTDIAECCDDWETLTDCVERIDCDNFNN